MRNLYGRREWRAFRSEIIRLYDGVCNRCQRGSDDGVILQVHHKIYIEKRLPWEYQYDQCEALCRGCHAQEHGIIPPHSGWEHFGDFDDLGELIGECEYCGTALRYVFPIYHSKWGTMEVGEQCCDKLTSTDFASEELSQHAKRMDRRTRFVSSKRWFIDKSGDPCIQQNGIFVRVVRDGSNYRLRISGTKGNRQFASELDAKITAFELIDSGKIRDWLRAKARPAHHQYTAHYHLR